MASRYLRKQTMRQIAEALEVSVTTVYKDLEALRQQWRASAAASISEIIAEQLAKLHHLESTAWQAWEASKGEMRVDRVRGGADGSGKVVEVTRRMAAGDPRFLVQVERCIDLQCKLLGVWKTTDPDASRRVRPLEHLSDNELLALAGLPTQPGGDNPGTAGAGAAQA